MGPLPPLRMKPTEKCELWAGPRGGAMGWTCAMKTELMPQCPHSNTAPSKPLQGSGHRAGMLTVSLMGPRLQGGGN